MLKVTKAEERDHGVVLRVEGRILARNVPELRRECEAVLGAAKRLVLDMNAVTYVDGEGARMLGSLPSTSCTFINCSEFLRDLLGRCGE